MPEPGGAPTELLDPSLRRRVDTRNPAAFQPYDRYGAPTPGLSWVPLARDTGRDYELFLLRFEPGARSTPHEHRGREEFLVLEGELHDCDGAVFGPGEFVSYEAGSRHQSVSPRGCLLLVSLHGANRRLEAAARPDRGE